MSNRGMSFEFSVVLSMDQQQMFADVFGISILFY